MCFLADALIIYLHPNVSVAWVHEGYECVLSGSITEEEAIKIIDSIYER